MLPMLPIKKFRPAALKRASGVDFSGNAADAADIITISILYKSVTFVVYIHDIICLIRIYYRKSEKTGSIGSFSLKHNRGAGLGAADILELVNRPAASAAFSIKTG